jgi:hypothetical protein
MGDAVELSAGGVSVATSKGMAVTAYGLTFAPSAHSHSKFEVVEYEDSVIVAARQGNVIVADGQQTSTVREGQELTHKKKTGGAPQPRAVIRFPGRLWPSSGASGATVASILIAESNKKKCVSSSNNKKCTCKKDKKGNEDCEDD